MGWKLGDFSLAAELKADEHGPALCDGKIDGFFYGVGHPSANIQDPTTTCGAKLVSLDRPCGRQAGRGEAVLREGDDSGRPVPEQSRSDTTYGVLATLVASSKTPPDDACTRW